MFVLLPLKTTSNKKSIDTQRLVETHILVFSNITTCVRKSKTDPVIV